MNNKRYRGKIKFKSYVAFNKYCDIAYFKKSKALNLLIYIATNIDRNPQKIHLYNEIISLSVGEFVLHKQDVFEYTDILKEEFDSVIEFLIKTNVIEITNNNENYVTGIWYENEMIDLNLPIKKFHPSYKEEERENNNNSYSSSFSSNSKKIEITKEHKEVFDAYSSLCKVEIPDYQKEYVFNSIDEMLQSKYTPKQVIQFMQWLKEIEGDAEYKWALGWNINHVKNKLPHFLAGKLRIPNMEDDYEYIGS